MHVFMFYILHFVLSLEVETLIILCLIHKDTRKVKILKQYTKFFFQY